MDVTVRVARPGELAAVGRLTETVYGGERLVGRDYLPVLAAAQARAAAPHTTVLVAVADRTDRLLGAATLAAPGSPYADLAGPDEVELRMLAVAREARRRGVGEALVSDAAARARAAGAAALVLSTVDGVMADAQRLYTRLGFHRRPDRDWSPRPGVTLAAYALPLAPAGEPAVRPAEWPGEPAGPPRVRPARAAEWAAAGALTAAAYVADGLLGPADPYLAELADAAGRAEAPHTELLVAVAGAEVGPAVLGTVTFVRPGSPYAEISRPGEAEFRMLAVDPGARGRGLGELLVRAGVERATRAGDRWLVLSTHPRMAAAHRLYGRLGFTRLPERDWTPVPGVDLLAYQLALRPGSSSAAGASGASGASGG